MYTRCPVCSTDFRITAAELRAAGGQVRCSICQTVFDTLPYLRDELTDPVPQPEAPASTILQSRTPADGDTAGASPQASPSDPRDEPRPALAFEILDDEPAPPPWVRPRRTQPSWPWAVLSLLAGAVLSAQIAYHLYPSWRSDPELRPWLTWACHASSGYLPGVCDLPPLTDLDRLALRGHSFTTHPEHPQALYFSASLANEAAFAQPYPLIHITLQNRYGDAVAVGHFGPADYLDQPMATDGTIAPGTSVPIRLMLKDPGPQAAGYQFRLESAR